MLKLLLAAALVVTPCPVATAISEQPAAIPKVVCPVFAGPVYWGLSMGSAFRIGRGLLISARHVTHFDQCFIGTQKITVSYESPKLDFAIITDGQDGPFYKVDCGGFVRGRRYLAVGHAHGRDELTSVELEATGKKDGQFSMLTGIATVIPGQSGGVVLDEETRRVVGIVNVYNPEQGTSGSLALADTPICGAKA